MNGKRMLGFIILIIIVIGVLTVFGHGNQPNQSSYNSTAVSFQFPNDWTLASNFTNSVGAADISIMENSTDGSNLIYVHKLVNLTSDQAYGTGPVTAMQQVEFYVNGSTFYGNKTDALTNNTYGYYLDSGNSVDKAIYVFEKGGNVYVIDGTFGMSNETQDSELRVMNTIFETIK
jgi:hypothetical protein